MSIHYIFGPALIQAPIVSKLAMRTLGPQDLLTPKEVTREGSFTLHCEQVSEQRPDFNEAGSSRRGQGFNSYFFNGP